MLPGRGVGLHVRVFDAVVDHLGEVAGADLPGVNRTEIAQVGGLRLERVEGRLDLRDVLGRAAVHQRIAVLQAPHAAGDTTVDIADLLLLQQLGVDQVVGPAGVAAIDHDVPGAEQAAPGLDGLAGRVTGRHHHPDTLRAGQPPDEPGA